MKKFFLSFLSKVKPRPAEIDDRNSALFQYSNEAILLGIPNGEITAANKAACELFDMTEAEICGAGRNGLSDSTDPRHSLAEKERAITGKVKYCGTYFRKDGVKFEAEISSVILEGGSRSLIIMRDITERKHTEEQLRSRAEELASIMKTAPVAIWVSRDPKCETISGNVMANSFYEAHEGENVSANASPERRFFRNGEEQQAEQLPMQEAARTGCEIKGAELEVLLPSGKRIFMFGSATPLKSSTGEVRGCLGAFLDITDRKQNEENLRRLALEREQLLESERAARVAAQNATRVKDVFLAMISHELRTPLNAVLGWIGLLKRKPSDFERGLAIIERNAKAQAQLIEDLLDINRIVSGKFDIEREEVSLVQVINQAIDSIQPLADEKGVGLDVSIGKLSKSFFGDAVRLQQVFWNLLTNALKFTPGGGNISVELREDGDKALIIVRDTGEGIEAEFLPQLFSRFAQGEVSISKRKRGLGLGLAISKAIVEHHGGTIMAQSEGKGLGAAFTTILPLEELERNNFVHKEEKTLTSFPAGLSVLVVEDEHDSREFLKRILEEKGAVVEAVSSAADALERLERKRPDIIVSDIGMPGMDGYAFIQSVRALSDERRFVPAIAVTAFARKEDEEKALEAGFSAHVPKPVNIGTLLRVINAAHREQSSLPSLCCH